MIHSARRLAPAALLSIASFVAAQDGQPNVLHPASPIDGSQPGYSVAIVYINEAGHPTNVVPGLGLPFNIGTSTSSAFQRPYISANGMHFGINVVAETATTADDDCLLLDGAVILREGDPALFGLTGELIGTIDSDFGINDLGEVLIGNNLAGTAPSAADDHVLYYSSGAWTSLAKEGDSISPFIAAPLGGTGGTWDDSMDGCRLRNDGTPLWVADGVDGLSTGTANDEFLVFGDGTFLQESVDIPVGQAGGAMEAWENFDFEDFHISGDGTIWVLQGDLTGSTTSDDVVAFNNVIIVQEGEVLAGSSFAEPVDLNGIVKVWLDSAGSYYVRGNNDVTETDWVYRNGAVVATSDGTSEIVPGSGEFFDDADFSDCFFAFDGNASGAYVIGGVTDAPSDSNGVIVYYDGLGGSVVMVREGDPVDLDGNGMFDDDRYFDTFGNDDCLLRDDGSIMFVASLRDGAGVDQSNGLFVIAPKTASCTLRNGTGVNAVACTCTSLPQIGSSFSLDVATNVNTLQTLVFAAFAPLPAPFPLFGGEALIQPPVLEIPGAGGGSHPLPLPNDLGLLGFELFVQGMRLQAVGPTLAIELVNGQDLVVGL